MTPVAKQGKTTRIAWSWRPNPPRADKFTAVNLFVVPHACNFRYSEWHAVSPPDVKLITPVAESEQTPKIAWS